MCSPFLSTLNHEEKTTKLVGGRLSTTLDQIFDNVSHDALNLVAKSPKDIVHVESTPAVVTSVGDVI